MEWFALAGSYPGRLHALVRYTPVMSQVMGIILDIGLGALAFNLARSLKSAVTSNSATRARVVSIQEDHEKRLVALEKDNQ